MTNELPWCGWRGAVELFRLGDRKPLAQLVRACVADPVTFERDRETADDDVVAIVAAIIEGRLQPDRRGLRRHTVAAAQKRQAVELVAHWRDVRDAMKRTKPLPRGWTLRRVELEYSRAIERLAAGLGVTVETVEGWTKPSRTK